MDAEALEALRVARLVQVDVKPQRHEAMTSWPVTEDHA